MKIFYTSKWTNEKKKGLKINENFTHWNETIFVESNEQNYLRFFDHF